MRIIALRLSLLASLLGASLGLSVHTNANADAQETLPIRPYMPADLRQRVDQLKLDRKGIATTAVNAAARAQLLWEWVNAYAVGGGYVPVNATLVVAPILGGNITPASMAALDAMIAEFSFLDDHPHGLGTLEATTGPFEVASFATIQQTYTVGSVPVQTGGSFLITRHFMANFGAWQTTDPQADHYISIRSSNPRVTFVTSTKPFAGMHGGFRSTRPTLAFEVASGTLIEGDTVTITYGDTNQGSKGIMTPSFASDRMPLPIYVSFGSDDRYISLPIQPIQTEGGAVAGVHAFAPSIVAPNESFTLSVRAQDQYYNRPNQPSPAWDVYMNDTLWQSTQDAASINLIQGTLSEPGVYYPTVKSADGSIQGVGNPILVTTESRPQIYWGDTHGHSGFAEGIGSAERFMQWAKEDARLDYVTHSEHDIWLDDAEWEVLRKIVSDYTEQGDFAAYLGYEWSVSNTRGGHHNVLYRTPQGRTRVASQFYPTLSKLYEGLRRQNKTEDVLIIPHAHQAGDYRQSDPELEPLVEIMSQHGSFEWFGRMYLEHGHQVGFIAASDNHLAQPGYSAPLGGSLSQRGGLGAILSDTPGVDGIFDAMKNLQAYATTGDRIILDFTVNGEQMGQRAPFSEARNIKGRVIGTAPIDTITVIKNNKEIWRKDYLLEDDNRQSKTQTYLLTFASDSEPFHRGDNPRGWRAWEGVLEVFNAKIESIQAYDANFPLQSVTPAEDNANRVTFATKTRGDTSSYLLTLSGVQRNTRLQLDIVENGETGGAPPKYRAPARIPALSFALAVRDMEDGQVSHKQVAAGYTDSATLRRIRTDGATDISFSFADPAAPTDQRQGDYYFVRVTQANDAIAWSSPIWIGGHATQ